MFSIKRRQKLRGSLRISITRPRLQLQERWNCDTPLQSNKFNESDRKRFSPNEHQECKLRRALKPLELANVDKESCDSEMLEREWLLDC